MLLNLRLPKTLLWVFNLLMIFLVMFTFFRLLTLIAFRPEGENVSGLIPSFWLGLRFDLRWISIFLLPVVIASFNPELSPFYSQKNRKIWTWYMAFVTFFVFFFFAADFGCFSYNKTRLNASALNFVEDPGISAKMLWQSYPIIWMLLGLMLSVLLFRLMFRKLHGSVVERTEGRGIRYKRKWFVLSALLMSFLVYGSTSWQPLKWKNAFQFDDSFKSYLALNPLQNFFTTLKFRSPQYNETRARAYYPIMKDWLNLDHQSFGYSRMGGPNNVTVKGKPNVVLVLCESFSMYKSSMSGNPLNTTPYFKSLCDSGIFFNRCFTPHFSTARGLFATLTGIPDVQLSKFSTRNPDALDQHTIINNFKDYSKFYFLGGSPSFNNFEGLIKNIDGVHMDVEGKFKSMPVNVWGISDKDLFMEANRVFSQQTKPFFAIVQTADNHRPFTIPPIDSAFQKQIISKEQLEQYGFESLEEYNAFRYADFCFRNFIENARKEAYFNNTIFVFVGDHGVSGNANNIYPAIWTEERLTEEHVPLLFYAPALIKPEKRGEVVSQVDVLPTIAGLTGQTYENTTLGRDVLNNQKGNHGAFIILHDEGRIGIVTDQLYFTKNLNFQHEELHFFQPQTTYSPHQLDSIKTTMSHLTTAYYETAQWMLMHNPRNPRP